MGKKSILNIPMEFDRSDFFSLVSLSIGSGIARQLAFGEIIGQNSWEVDFGNLTITFGEHKFGCGIIGSESEHSSTWLWGWANGFNGWTEEMTAPGIRAKEAVPECDEFTVEGYDLDELHNGHNISIAIVGMSEKNVCYYRCPYDGGALFVLVEGVPDEVFKPLSLDDIVHRCLKVIQSAYCDHRLLLAGMLWESGYEFTDGGSFIECEADSKKLHMDFECLDEISRITNIEFS